MSGPIRVLVGLAVDQVGIVVAVIAAAALGAIFLDQWRNP